MKNVKRVFGIVVLVVALFAPALMGLVHMTNGSNVIANELPPAEGDLGTCSWYFSEFELEHMGYSCINRGKNCMRVANL